MMNLNSKRNLIDISVAIDVKGWEPSPVKRKVVDHKKGADLLGKTLLSMKGSNGFLKIIEWLKHKCGFGLSHKDFPEGKGLSLYTYELTTHTGTHLDAPYHFGDKNKAGDKAKTITDIPLEWCLGNGVLLELESLGGYEPISKEEIIAKLAEIRYQIKPFDIVLLKTGGDRYIGTPRYFTDFRGVSAEGTEYLLDCGVKIIGIDSFGFDPPFYKMIQNYSLNKEKKHLWPAHFLGRRKEYCHIERLTNLDQIKQTTGFQVCCFPIKLSDSDAAWCRAVVIEG